MKSFSLVFILFISLYACKNESPKKQENKKTEISFKKQGNLQVIDSAGAEKASFDIEFATTDYEQQTGLMYRTKMKDRQGMLFIFEDAQPRYFYMKNTYIPLDIIFVAPDSSIVSIAKDAKALDETVLPSGKPAKFVLEIKAGLSNNLHIQKGDKVSWKKL